MVKAIVLAAGRGERMRPISDEVPKPLLGAGGRSLIEWQITRLVAAGVRDIVVNVSHLAHRIEHALGDGGPLGARIRYSHEAQALETAGGIARALPLLGDDIFVAVNADVYCEFEYTALLRTAESLRAAGTSRGAHLVLVDNPQHHPDGDFGLTAHGRVTNEAHSRLTFSGIGVYQPGFFAAIAAGERKALAPLLRTAAAEGRLHGEHYRGVWMDVGTPERWRALQALLEHPESSSPANNAPLLPRQGRRR